MVKAFDSKSNGIFPRRFESYLQRPLNFGHYLIMKTKLILRQILPANSGYAAMAEWLRRLTRNQMGSSRVGSNPTRSGKCEQLRLSFQEVRVRVRSNNLCL